MVLSKVLSCVMIEDDLYCVDGQIGYLYRIRLTDWKVESLGRLEFEWVNMRVTDLFLYQGDIWCVPSYAKQIAKYHLNSGEIMYFEPNYEIVERLYTVFRDGVLYMIPLKPFEDLLEFHIDENCFRINKNWRKEIWREDRENERFLMAAFDGDNLIVTQKSTKEVIQIDFRNLGITRYKIAASDNLYGVVWMNGYFYFTAEKERKIIIWNQEENSIREYKDCWQDGKFYLRPVSLLDRLLLTDGQDQYCFKEGFFSNFQEIENLAMMYENSSFYYRTYLWKDKILLPPCSANMFLELDLQSYKAKGKRVTVPWEDVWDCMEKHLFIDEKEWSLEVYLEMITRGVNDSISWEKDTYGAAIYEKILG